MKKYLRKPNHESDGIDRVHDEEYVEVDPETYDDSDDPDDTYYSFDSVTEMLKWLKRERN